MSRNDIAKSIVRYTYRNDAPTRYPLFKVMV